ncbi:hypothetical protein QBC43DRAFT_356949 [Cladorrhinum sp. PSN259]|nr:hypothetical protein QBC43DRAFT_356949 [Cladorrhinum sp. PSN259]
MHPLATSRMAAAAALIAVIQMMAMMLCAWAFVPRAYAGCFTAAYTVLFPPLFLFLMAFALPTLARFCDLAKQIDVDWVGCILSSRAFKLVIPIDVGATSMVVGNGTILGILSLLTPIMSRLRSSSFWAVMMHWLLTRAEAYADYVCKGAASKRESLGQLLESSKRQYCEQLAKISGLNDHCVEISRKAQGCRGACRHDLKELYPFFNDLLSFKVVVPVQSEESPMMRGFGSVFDRLAHPDLDMSMWWTKFGHSRLQAAISVNQGRIDDLSQVLGQKEINYRIIAEHVETCNCTQDTRALVLARALSVEPKVSVVPHVKRLELRKDASTAERVMFRRTRRKVWSQSVLPVTETAALTPLTPVVDEATSLTGPELPVSEAIESPILDTDHRQNPQPLPSTSPISSNGPLPEGFDHKAYLAEWEAKRDKLAADQEAAALKAARQRLHWSRTVLAPQERELAHERARLDELTRQVYERRQEEEKNRLLLEDAPRTEEDRRPLAIQEQLRRAEERTANLDQEANAHRSKVNKLREALRAAEADLEAAEESVKTAKAEEDALRRQLCQPASDDEPGAIDSPELEAQLPITDTQQHVSERPLSQNVDDSADEEKSLPKEESSEGTDLGGSREPENEGTPVLVADNHDVDLECHQAQLLIQPSAEATAIAAETATEVVTMEGVPTGIDMEAIADTSMTSAPETEVAPNDNSTTAIEDSSETEAVNQSGQMRVSLFDTYMDGHISLSEYSERDAELQSKQNMEHILQEADARAALMTSAERGGLLAEILRRPKGVNVQMGNSTLVDEPMLDVPMSETEDDNVADGTVPTELPVAPTLHQVVWPAQQRRVDENEEQVRGAMEGQFPGSELGTRSEYQPETISQPALEPVVVPKIEDTVMEDSNLIDNHSFQAVTGATADIPMLCASTQGEEPDVSEGESNEDTDNASAMEVIQEVCQVVEGACCPETPEQLSAVSVTSDAFEEPEATAEGEGGVTYSNTNEELEAIADGEEWITFEESEAYAEDEEEVTCSSISSSIIEELEAIADGEVEVAPSTTLSELQAYADREEEVIHSSSIEEPEARADDGEDVELAQEAANMARPPAPVQQAVSATRPGESNHEAIHAPVYRPVFRRPHLRKTAQDKAKVQQELREIEERRLQASGGIQPASKASESAEGSSSLNKHDAEGSAGESGVDQPEAVEAGEGNKGQQPEADADEGSDEESDNDSDEEFDDESEDEDMPDDDSDDDSDGAPPPPSNTDGDVPEPYNPTQDYIHPSDDEPEEPDLEDEFGALCAARRADTAARVETQQRQREADARYQEAVEEAQRRDAQRRAEKAMEAERLRKEEEEKARRQRAREYANRAPTTQQPQKRGRDDDSESPGQDIDDQAAMVTEDEGVCVVQDIRTTDKRATTEQKSEEEKKVIALFEANIPGAIISRAQPPPGTVFPQEKFVPKYGPETFSTHIRAGNSSGTSARYLNEMLGSAASCVSSPSQAPMTPQPPISEMARPDPDTPMPGRHQWVQIDRPGREDTALSLAEQYVKRLDEERAERERLASRQQLSSPAPPMLSPRPQPPQGSNSHSGRVIVRKANPQAALRPPPRPRKPAPRPPPPKPVAAEPEKPPDDEGRGKDEQMTEDKE